MEIAIVDRPREFDAEDLAKRLRELKPGESCALGVPEGSDRESFRSFVRMKLTRMKIVGVRTQLSGGTLRVWVERQTTKNEK